MESCNDAAIVKTGLSVRHQQTLKLPSHLSQNHEALVRACEGNERINLRHLELNDDRKKEGTTYTITRGIQTPEFRIEEDFDNNDERENDESTYTCQSQRLALMEWSAWDVGKIQARTTKTSIHLIKKYDTNTKTYLFAEDGAIRYPQSCRLEIIVNFGPWVGRTWPKIRRDDIEHRTSRKTGEERGYASIACE